VVITVVVMKISVFWDIRLCTPLKVSSGSVDCLLHAGFLLGLFFSPEDGSNIFL
jgi:hypothetical protein